MRAPRAAPWSLAGLSIALGMLWALVVPPFGAPDEPAHLQAVAQVRDRGELPRMEVRFDSDPDGVIVWPPADRAIVAAARRAGQTDPLRLAPYESFQPPLYYVLGALATVPWRDDPLASLYVLRAISVLFGAGTVVACWWAARWLAPGEPLWAWAAAGLLALVPQAGFNAATAGNDSLVNFLCAVGLASLFRSLRDRRDDRFLVRAGAIAGAALLTKQNGLALVPAIALTALFRARDAGEGRRLAALARLAFGSSVSFFVVGGWTFLRNIWVYGEPTGVAAIARHFRSRFITIDVGSASAWEAVLVTAWQSFWGRFGWMDKRLPDWAYTGTFVIVAALVMMTCVRLMIRWRTVSRVAWRCSSLMAVVWLATAGLFLWVNFVSHGFQAQGRYFLPAAVPIVLAITGGLAWSGPSRAWRHAGLGALGAWPLLMQVMGWMVVRG